VISQRDNVGDGQPSTAGSGPGTRRRGPIVALLLVTALLGIVSITTWLFSRPARVHLSAEFTGSRRLLTNELAYWAPGSPGTRQSSLWQVTSGSLFADHGTGWTGVPDDRRADPTSSQGTHSAVFRTTSRRADFGVVSVQFELDDQGLTSTGTTPPRGWDGVHILLRYHSETQLYAASIDRRDNTVVVKKKISGGDANGGTYYTLGQAEHRVRYGMWRQIKATMIDDAVGHVVIRLYEDGRLVLRVVDDGRHGAPIKEGRVGLRGDNCNFRFRDFVVTRLTSQAARDEA
jgi:hypothetical protein